MATETDATSKPKEKIGTTLIYMPGPHDPDETKVNGVVFKAYEPFDVGEPRMEMARSLSGNPWFTNGAVNADRKTAWEKVRKAQKELADRKAETDHMLADPIGAANGAAKLTASPTPTQEGGVVLSEPVSTIMPPVPIPLVEPVPVVNAAYATTLPPAKAKGEPRTVTNGSGHAVAVFPASEKQGGAPGGDSINALGHNAAIVLEHGTSTVFTPAEDGVWKSAPRSDAAAAKPAPKPIVKPLAPPPSAPVLTP